MRFFLSETPVGPNLMLMFRSHLEGMPTRPGIQLSNAASRFCGVLFACLAVVPLRADDVPLTDCPEPVRQTIELHRKSGKLDDIKRFSIGDHVLYLVHFDLKGFRDLRLQIRGDGTLQKSVEEIRRPDLPEAVRKSLDPMLVKGAHIEEIEKVIADGVTRYRIEIEKPHVPDQVVLFDEAGALVSDK